MTYLSLALLGPFRATVGDRPVTAFRSEKVRALLAYLAIESEQPHSRQALAGLLWPDLPTRHSMDNVRVTLYRLRHTLDAARPGLSDQALTVTRQTVQLNAAAVRVDVAQFEAGLATAAPPHPLPLNAALQTQLAQAVALYQGELLAGFSLADAPAFEEWLLLRREQLAMRAQMALKMLADSHEAQGELEQAHTYAARLLELDPYAEASRRQLMWILAQRGLPDQALAQYAMLRKLLRDELGVEPNAETVSLYEQIRRGEIVAVPQPHPAQPRRATPLPPVTANEVPFTGFFAGRAHELATLEQWLVGDRCRLVAVLGLGGVGKTSLVAHAASAVAGQFDRVLWRSLLNAPPLDTLLAGLLQSLAAQPLIDLPKTLDQQIDRLIADLHSQRVLLVLDNMESILDLTQTEQHEYEAYNQFLQRVATSDHRSTLILTSRERPLGVSRLYGEARMLQVLTLEGLDDVAGRTLLAERGVAGSSAAETSLVARYSGHPLALKLVADTVQDLFAGDIEGFLAQDTIIFDDVRKVLEEQIDRLTELEQSILFWLAVEREAVDVQTIRHTLLQLPGYVFLESLRKLQNLSLLERQADGLTLQNVVMEYLTERLVATVCAEIETGQLALFHRHALLKAEAKDYVRQSQTRLILAPIAEQAQAALGRPALEAKLGELLDQLRRHDRGHPSYAAGNLLNLLLHLGIDVTGYDFSQLCVWQADLRGARLAAVNFTGADLSGTTFTEDFGRIFAMAIHPKGHLLAVGGAHGAVRIWSLPNGQNAGLLTGHTNAIRSLSWSPDGTLLASAALDRRICIWDWRTGRCLTVLTGHKSGIYAIAFHPAGDVLVSGSQDRTLRLWEVSTGRQIGVIAQHTDSVNAVAFHPQGDLLVSGGNDHALYLWDLSSLSSLSYGESYAEGSSAGVRLLDRLDGHEQPISVVAFSPDGSTLASADADAVIHLWDSAERRLQATLPSHAHWVRSLVFTPDGSQLISGGADRVIRIWEIAERRVTEVLHGHELAVRAMAIHPDGSLLASGGLDDTIRLWNLRHRRHEPAIRTIRGHITAIRTLDFSPDGAQLASGDGKGYVRLWPLDGSEATPPTPHTLPGRGRQVNQVAFSPDGQWLASADEERQVRIWDVASLQPLGALQGFDEAVRALRFAPQGQVMATAGNAGLIHLWDISLPSQGRLITRLSGHTQEINDLLFTPDSRHLISGAADYSLRVWDLATGQCIQTIEEENGHCKTLALAPTRRLVAAAGWAGIIRLYLLNQENRLEPFHAFKVHATRIAQIAFHPEGRHLISAGQSGTVRMWDVDTGQPLMRWHGHTQQVQAVSFHPNGLLPASAGEDETIRLWRYDAEKIHAAAGQAEPPEGECEMVLRAPGPYKGMRIGGATGISEAQRSALIILGAVDDAEGDLQRSS